MKIDAHQHFWQYNASEYGWIGENMEVLKKDFLPSHLQSELKKVSFYGSIAVQARQTVEETEWLLFLASQHDFIRGVVGWLDLCSENIETQIQKYSINPKLVGLRHVVHDEPDDSFMARSDFQHGISVLKKYNLTYDLLIFPKHLQVAYEMVKKFPGQKFVLDHIAKPDIKNQIKENWKSDIVMLAQLPNVYCKLSGMVTEADWGQWKFSDFTFYLDTIFQAFGTDRLMIGSDWPVCLLAGSYEKNLNLVFSYIKDLPERDKEKILGLNCIKFYGAKYNFT